MSENEQVLAKYIGTVRELLKEQGETEALSICNSDMIECLCDDNRYSDDDPDYYSIIIYILPAEYIQLQKKSKVEEIEETIRKAFNIAERGTYSTTFVGVRIAPSILVKTRKPYSSNIDEPTIWTLGYYRMFISHCTENKSSARMLDIALKKYGIKGFVAHEDIVPGKLWIDEITKALFTADALCAIYTPSFIESKWCDQEVGIAMGRGLEVIPIRKSDNPYGFIGQIQGVPPSTDAHKIARKIFQILCDSEKSKKAYSERVVNLFLNSKDTDEAVKWAGLLNDMPSIDKSNVENIYFAYYNNKNLIDDAVLSQANLLFEKHALKKLSKKAKTVETQVVDDLPF